jgi:hypothetical protein
LEIPESLLGCGKGNKILLGLLGLLTELEGIISLSLVLLIMLLISLPEFENTFSLLLITGLLVFAIILLFLFALSFDKVDFFTFFCSD